MAALAFTAGVTGRTSAPRRSKRASSSRGRAAPVRRAVSQPVEADVPSPENQWQRVVRGGVQNAGELWKASGVGAAGREAREKAMQWAGKQRSHRVLLSDIIASPKTNWFFNRDWKPMDVTYTSFIGALHVGALLAPLAFSWGAFQAFLGMYFVTGCLGITLSYHRQLSHKSFKTPKWLEYALAYCGALAVQGDPNEWVSSHRYHHLYCDTPMDPHTPYEGFWWSHAGWLLDNETTLERVGDRSNASDMYAQPFYAWLEKTYIWHIAASALATFGAGAYFGGSLYAGVSTFLWAFCFRAVWVYHITWAVNSVAHVWGSQMWNTGDLSRNNAAIGLLAFGEGWHNNHHAFEFSARHGLKWWQLDMTWMIISAFKAVGLATNVKLPSQSQMDRLALPAK